MLVKLALAHPQLVKRLVLIGAPIGGASGQESSFPKFDLGDEFLEALEAKDVLRALSIFIPTVVSEPGTEALADLLLNSLISLPRKSIEGFFASDPDMDISSVMQQVAAPTLVMHGTEDRRVPLKCASIIAESIPGAVLHQFPECGHLPWITAPGEFCEVLRHFMRTGEVPPQPGAGK
ncbi:MAG: alpha/beta hydrolase [SAR324 cluster bacterium]|nr:alpha/beta hydrolase [SAR324 cluster bacterium]